MAAQLSYSDISPLRPADGSKHGDDELRLSVSSGAERTKARESLLSRCLHGEPPVIYGDGTQTRDFTYIEDIVRVNAQLLEDDSADGEILNIGSTDNIDILTLAEVIRDAIDPTLELEFDEAREGDAEHTHADISKANEILGYEPTVDIRDGVSKFIDWYRDNREWYDPLVRSS